MVANVIMIILCDTIVCNREIAKSVGHGCSQSLAVGKALV